MLDLKRGGVVLLPIIEGKDHNVEDDSVRGAAPIIAQPFTPVEGAVFRDVPSHMAYVVYGDFDQATI